MTLSRAGRLGSKTLSSDLERMEIKAGARLWWCEILASLDKDPGLSFGYNPGLRSDTWAVQGVLVHRFLRRIRSLLTPFKELCSSIQSMHRSQTTYLNMYVNSYESSPGRGSVNQRCPQDCPKPRSSARIGFWGGTGVAR